MYMKQFHCRLSRVFNTQAQRKTRESRNLGRDIDNFLKLHHERALIAHAQTYINRPVCSCCWQAKILIDFFSQVKKATSLSQRCWSDIDYQQQLYV